MRPIVHPNRLLLSLVLCLLLFPPEVSGTINVSSKTYTFLQAAGGVTSAFDSIDNRLPFFDTTLIYNSQSIQLWIDRDYVSPAQTFNQRAVGNYLNDHGPGPTVYNGLNLLTTPQQARDGRNSLSGEMYGSLSTVGIENTGRFLQTIASRLRSQSLGQRFIYTPPAFEEATVVIRGQNALRWARQNLFRQIPWLEGYGASAEIASDGNAGGLDYSTGGVAFGLEQNLNQNTLLGLVGGYSQTSVQFDRQADWSKINSAQAGIYLQYDNGLDYATGIAAYGHNNYTVRRHILPQNISYESTKGYSGNEFSFYLETGQNYYFPIVYLQPFAALQYIQLHQNQIRENDAESVSLWIGGVHADSFRGLLGLRAVHDIQLPNYQLLSFEGRAIWRHEFLDEARVLDARFANQLGDTFAVRGVNVDRDAAILGTGLTFCLKSGVELYGNYDLLISENYTAHAGTGGLLLVW